MGFFERKERMKLLGKTVILGMAAVWDDRKGYNNFIELSKKLDKDYKIIMVGLTKRQRSQTPENIIALAKTNYIEELRCLYSVADIFLILRWKIIIRQQILRQFPAVHQQLPMRLAEARKVHWHLD